MIRSFPDPGRRLVGGLLALALAGCPMTDDADDTDGDETGADSGGDSGTTVEVPGDSGGDSDTWPWMLDTDATDSGDSGPNVPIVRHPCRDPFDPNGNPFRDTSDGRLTVEELCPGDLVITEVLRGSTDGPPTYAAYLEVVNPTPWEVVLSGVQIDVGPAAGLFAVTGVPILAVPGRAAFLAPGERVVVRLQATEPPTHLINFAFQTGELVVPYSAATLYLTNGAGWHVDAVDHRAYDVASGIALQLRPEVDVTDDNAPLAPDAWCSGGLRLPLAGAGGLGNDRGTPGFENVCDPPPPVDTGDSGDTDTDTDTDSGDSGDTDVHTGDSGVDTFDTDTDTFDTDTDVDTGDSAAP